MVDQGSFVTFDLLVEAFLFLDLSVLLAHLLSLLKRLLTPPNLRTAPLHLSTMPLKGQNWQAPQGTTLVATAHKVHVGVRFYNVSYKLNYGCTTVVRCV